MTANIDATEVDRYNRLAALWWDADGPMWPLHRLNDLRSPWICEKICQHLGRDQNAPQPLAGLRILDIGCGGGLLSESMTRLGAVVTALDVAEQNIYIARQHADAAGLQVDYRHTDIEGLGAGSWDVVLNMEVVEHVPDVQRFLQACHTRIAPGGMTVLATINRTFLAAVVAIFGAEYVLRLLPRGTHQWQRFVKPAELRTALLRDGLRSVASTGVRVNPLTRHLSLCKTEAVNYMLAAVRDD